MIFKVNNVVSENQVKMLSDFDVLGLSVSNDAGHPDFLSFSDAEALIKSFPDKTFSLFLDWESDGLAGFISSLTEYKNVKYIEFLCPDFYKKDKFEEFCLLLRKVDLSVILKGFFLMQDDLGMLENKKFFISLSELGVSYFQFDMESICDSEFMIKKSDTQKIASFFDSVPVLLSDAFKSVKVDSLLGAKGVSLSVKNSVTMSSRGDYRFSDNVFSLSELKRLVRYSGVA